MTENPQPKFCRILSLATPPYFTEGLFLNVPQERFGGSYVAIVENAFPWVSDNAPPTTCAPMACIL